MTKYYIRHLECGNMYTTTNSISDNKMLYVFDSNYGMTKDHIFNKMNETNLYTIGYMTPVLKYPLSKTTETIDEAYWYNDKFTFYHKETGDDSLLIQGWTSRGWSDYTSSQSTFANEVANYVESAKVSNTDWGIDSGHINIYIFSYTRSSYTYLFVTIFKGNDSNYDEIIEV